MDAENSVAERLADEFMKKTQTDGYTRDDLIELVKTAAQEGVGVPVELREATLAPQENVLAAIEQIKENQEILTVRMDKLIEAVNETKAQEPPVLAKPGKEKPNETA